MKSRTADKPPVVLGVAFAAGLLLALCSGCSSSYMKGTPLYTGEYSAPQGPPEERVNLWPAFYYHEPAVSILWPIGERTEDHVAARPLFSIYKLDKERHQYNVLWPLGELDFDTHHHRIFPFFWSAENDYFVLFPLIWYSASEYFNLFPVLWYSPGNHFGLFPLFMRYDLGTGTSTHALWPLFKYKRDIDELDWRLWPLIGHKRDGNELYQYLLWPLMHYWRDSTLEKTVRVAFPLYFSGHSPDIDWDIVLPLFGRYKSDDSSGFFSLLYNSYKKGDDFWRLVMPFYCRSHLDGEEQLVTPLFGRSWSSDHSTWSVIPLISWFTKKDAQRDLWLLGALAHFRWGGFRTSHVFPFYYYNELENLFITPLFGKAGTQDDGFFTLLGPLFIHRRDSPVRWQTYALWPFMSLYDHEYVRGGYFWPLFGHKHYTKNGKREGYALWPLIHYSLAPNDKQWGVLPLFYSMRSERTYPRQEGAESVTCRRRFLYLFPTFWNRRRIEERTETVTNQAISSNYRSTGLWPLWQYKSDQNENRLKKDFSILGWLYDRRTRKQEPTMDQPGEDYVRSRILWRVMHYERTGDKKSLDVFPFIAYDSEKDSGFRKFSFAWRLFRRERERDGNVKLDILFIPILR